MVNQQLKDYISEQVKVGVSRDAIRGALLEAGWQEGEINEAMNVPRVDAVAKPSAPAVRQDVQVKKVDIVSTPVTIPAQGKKIASNPISISFGKSNSRPEQTEERPFQAKSEPVRIPSSSADYAMPAGSILNPHPSEKLSFKHRIAHIVMGVLILTLGVAGASLFIKSSNLDAKLGFVSNERESAIAELASVKEAKSALELQVAELTEKMQEADAELAIFVSPNGLTFGEEEITISGMLDGSTGKTAYTLITSRGTVVILKNSREADVQKVLEPLIGEDVVLVMSHEGGSKLMTVLSVNGESVVAPVSAPTPETD